MACPACNSDDWKLASLIYKEGLANISTTTTGAGIGGSGPAFGGGVARTTGTQQSALSKEAAPPTGFIKTTIFSVLALITALIAIFGHVSLLWLGVALIVYGIYRVYPGEKKANEAAMAKWKATRMCIRCGTFYAEPA